MKPWMVVLLIAAGVLCFLARWGKLVPVVASVEMGHPVVVLDAGHGGEDGGAMTASGHRESDINLQIVNKLDDFIGVHRYFIHWEMWVVSGGSTPSRRSGM